MKVIYNVTDRKPLVKALEEITGKKAIYKRTPTYAYEIGGVTVTREGNLELDEYETELIKSLSDKGFTPQEMPNRAVENEVEKVVKEAETKPQNENVGLTAAIPIDDVNIENLTALLKSKGQLIKKAIGVKRVDFKIVDEKIIFPWFETTEHSQTYINLISALCKMSKEQKRINPAEKEVSNDKYAFRCFLLRLGFIGDKYKADRKVLLNNLSGSSAFKEVTNELSK